MSRKIHNKELVNETVVKTTVKKLTKLEQRFKVETCNIEFAKLGRYLGYYHHKDNLIQLHFNLENKRLLTTIDHEFCHHLVEQFHPDNKEHFHGKTFQAFMKKLGYSKEAFKSGDRVYYITLDGYKIEGTVTDVKRIRVWVKTTLGMEWRMHPDMLTKMIS